MAQGGSPASEARSPHPTPTLTIALRANASVLVPLVQAGISLRHAPVSDDSFPWDQKSPKEQVRGSRAFSQLPEQTTIDGQLV